MEYSNCYGILVSKNYFFMESEWRHAITHYLFGMWGNKEGVSNRLEIQFCDEEIIEGGISLLLVEDRRKYNAIADYEYFQETEIPRFDPSNYLEVFSDRASVHDGLMRFVKDNSIWALDIVFGEQQSMTLWKHRRRGKLSFSGKNLETFLPPEAMRLV